LAPAEREKSMKKDFEFETTCCICGCEVYGIGKNPWPLVKREGAVCCSWCDSTVVIPARLKQFKEESCENE